MALKNPSHPGEIIADEVLPAFGLSVAAAARVLRMPRPNLANILAGKAGLSHAVALKIEKAFKVDAGLLTAMQNAWDLARARESADRITDGVEPQTLSSGPRAARGGMAPHA